ncbi:MAG: MerR family transcriptional regulator [Candidatus Acidiferrales bacterium]
MPPTPRAIGARYACWMPLSTVHEQANLTLYCGIEFKIAIMQIGELSKRAGVNIQTVRFYERQKLLREPTRTSSGYRLYVDADLEQVRFIKMSQQLGFTLKEIKELINIHEPGQSNSHRENTSSWERAFQITKERLNLIDEKIRILKKLRLPLLSALKQAQTKKMTVCPADYIRKQRKKSACPAISPRKKTS